MAEFVTSAKSGTFWLGVTLSLCGSLCSALGLACQRLSHKRNNELPPEQQVRSSRQWLNLLGVFLLFVESLFDLASFGFAPASILSCMGAMTLVFNMILAPLICGETVSKRDVGVNAVVFVGIIISVWFGPNETPDYVLTELLEFFIQPRFLVYAAILLTWIGVLMYTWFCLRDPANPRGRRFSTMELTTRTRLLRFTYPALAGSIGGNTAVFAKASIELVKTSIKGNNQFIYAGTYFMIFLMVVCVLAQLKFLNGGLKRYESLFVVPVYQVFWITCGVMGALFYLDEVSSISNRDLGLFCLGALVSVFGILLHSTRTAPKDPASMLEEEENESCSCATPAKEAFEVVEEYSNEFYAISKSVPNLTTTSLHEFVEDPDEERYKSEPMLMRTLRGSEPTVRVTEPMLRNVDSLESLQSDEDLEGHSEGGDVETGTDSFVARRRRFMTA
jgi:hypothetical protein